jgi:hypothetical protein
MHDPDGLVYSHEKASFGKSFDHHSSFIFSGLSSVDGRESQVRSRILGVIWGLNRFHEFLHFRNALFSKVSSNLSFDKSKINKFLLR